MADDELKNLLEKSYSEKKLGFIHNGVFYFRRKSNSNKWITLRDYKATGNVDEKEKQIRKLKKEIKQLEKIDKDSFEYILDIDDRRTQIDELVKEIAYVKAESEYKSSRGIGSTSTSTTGN